MNHPVHICAIGIDGRLDQARTSSILGNIPRGVQRRAAGLEIASCSEAVLPLLWVLPAAVLLCAGEAQKERAIELYAGAARYPLVQQSRWFADVAGDRIGAIAATLPPPLVSAARERGFARGLDATVHELGAALKGAFQLF